MLRILRFLVLFFLLVIVPRVSAYAMQFSSVSIFGLDLSGFVAFAFAAGLSATVFLSTYSSSIAANRLRELEDKGFSFISRKEMKNLRKKQARTKAEDDRLQANSEYGRVYSAYTSSRAAAIIFAIIEGVFNLAEVISAAITNGQITSPWSPFSLELFSIWVFAATPTVASILLAIVIANFDRVKDSLNLKVEGFFEEVGVNKPTKSEKAKETFYDILPPVIDGVPVNPEIQELRERDLTALTNQEKFEAAMWNRELDSLDTKLSAKHLGVSTRTVQRYLKDLKTKRETYAELRRGNS